MTSMQPAAYVRDTSLLVSGSSPKSLRLISKVPTREGLSVFMELRIHHRTAKAERTTAASVLTMITPLGDEKSAEVGRNSMAVAACALGV